ncbi:hypothetical protein SLI_0648 [Streptomyces lividans 1326]|uniref:Uncharacterized protein n=1 Tax=Streptomyces lividans 1326 TaxID=1200984 RepID=A0A7U9DPH4_STRLI|nr:hypothetical protein SLI_0648 [Streptomyces lividans 1326]
MRAAARDPVPAGPNARGSGPADSRVTGGAPRLCGPGSVDMGTWSD